MLKRISLIIIAFVGLIFLVFVINRQFTQAKSTQSIVENKNQTNAIAQPTNVQLTTPASAATTTPILPIPKKIHTFTYSFAFANHATEKLLALIHDAMHHLRHNRYELGGRYFNLTKGSYVIDCSGYVDHLLSTADPRAYSNLKEYTGCETPTSVDYYSFFRELPTTKIKHDWFHVAKVSDLKAGDILVFRYKDMEYRRAPGHVMVVMDEPQHLSHEPHIFSVRVSDSAPTRHSHDTRTNHSTGIGIGTLLLQADTRTGAPVAFAWKVGAPLQYNMYIAMARPESTTPHS